MASTIKVDNIQDQCGSAVVTKCGASKTLTVTTTKADNYQAADGGNIINQCGTTITLGASGDTINLASGASQTGFGRTGTVDWETTPKTATFTAVSGEGYFCNTTSGAFTVNLPAGSAGAIVSLADYAATWQTNALTVSPNGSEKIGSVNADVVLSTEGQSVTFVYVDSTQGWINTMDSTSNVRGNPNLAATGGTITTCGDYKIHTFTGPGTFTVSSTSTTAANNTVSYLVVAGGGGGSAGPSGGGGGGGGFREYRAPVSGCYAVSPLNGNPGGTAVTVTAQAYPITVGGGGPGGVQTPTTTPGTRGSNSIFSTVTSTGGGGGGVCGSVSPNQPGGSGGGSRYYVSPGGVGNTPPVSPPQGQPGGAGSSPATTGNYPAGGGGGATEAGVCGPNTGPNPSGRGGAGASTSITGSSVARSGGGGGGYYAPVNAPGAGSPCGTGTPGAGSQNAAVNTGGGAGSSGPGGTGGNGGSGVVIIRYKFQ
jgi:hypothetical protein